MRDWYVTIRDKIRDRQRFSISAVSNLLRRPGRLRPGDSSRHLILVHCKTAGTGYYAPSVVAHVIWCAAWRWYKAKCCLSSVWLYVPVADKGDWFVCRRTVQSPSKTLCQLPADHYAYTPSPSCVHHHSQVAISPLFRMPLPSHLKASAAVLDNIIKTTGNTYVAGIGVAISLLVEVSLWYLTLCCQLSKHALGSWGRIIRFT